jgi:hypothetical protein
MWRVQRLDQINGFKPANPSDFKSLALKIRKKQIGRFKTVIRAKRGRFAQRVLGRRIRFRSRRMSTVVLLVF